MAMARQYKTSLPGGWDAIRANLKGKFSDVLQDRKRINTSSSSAPSASPIPQRGNSKPVGIGAGSSLKIDDPIEDIYSKSQTERRIEESDFLKSILERTQQNFIDVAQKPSHIDEKDAEEREATYAEQLQVGTSVISAHKNPLPLLQALPVPYFSGPQAVEGLLEVMGRASLLPSEKLRMKAYAAEIAAAVAAVQIMHLDTVVVTFEEFSRKASAQ